MSGNWKTVSPTLGEPVAHWVNHRVGQWLTGEILARRTFEDNRHKKNQERAFYVIRIDEWGGDLATTPAEEGVELVKGSIVGVNEAQALEGLAEYAGGRERFELRLKWDGKKELKGDRTWWDIVAQVRPAAAAAAPNSGNSPDASDEDCPF